MRQVSRKVSRIASYSSVSKSESSSYKLRLHWFTAFGGDDILIKEIVAVFEARNITQKKLWPEFVGQFFTIVLKRDCANWASCKLICEIWRCCNNKVSLYLRWGFWFCLHRNFERAKHRSVLHSLMKIFGLQVIRIFFWERKKFRNNFSDVKSFKCSFEQSWVL